MENICKGKIYPTTKSKLPVRRCNNKAKDNNGYCNMHKKQSAEYTHTRQAWADIDQARILISCSDKSIYEGEIEIRMKSESPVYSALNKACEYFGLDGADTDYALYYKYNGRYVEIDTPACMCVCEPLILIENGG
jgi:hypothetical protein